MLRPLPAVLRAARSTTLTAARPFVHLVALPGACHAARATVLRVTQTGALHSALRAMALTATLALAPSAHAAGMTAPDLAKARACLGCHQVDTKRVGPAWKTVANKYAGQPDAQAWLETSIRRGSANKWGKIPMPAQTHVTATEAQQLAAWILTLK